MVVCYRLRLVAALGLPLTAGVESVSLSAMIVDYKVGTHLILSQCLLLLLGLVIVLK